MNTAIELQQVIANEYHELISTVLASEITSVTKLSQGLSGATTYKLSCVDKEYVLKITTPEAQRLISGKHNEYKNMLQIMSDCEIIPKIHYIELRRGIILMDYINPKPYSLSQNEHLQKMVKLLNKLHQIQGCDGLQKCSLGGYLSYADDNLQEIKESHTLPPYVDGLRKRIDLIKDIVESNWSYQLCHLDINPSNVIYDGSKFYLLD